MITEIEPMRTRFPLLPIARAGVRLRRAVDVSSLQPRLGLLVVLSVLASAVPAAAQNVFSGTWRHGTDGQVAWVTSDWKSFTSKWDELGRSGMRMHDFETYLEGADRVWAGIFRSGNDNHAAVFLADWNQFALEWARLERAGLRMHDFETWVDGRTRSWAGIFRAGTGGRAVVITPDWKLFTATWEDHGREGLRMHDFETYLEGGVRWYVGIFRAGTDNHAAHFSADWSDFTAKWNELANAGLRMHDFEIWDDGGQTSFAGIFRQGTGGRFAWFGADSENFFAKAYELLGFNLRINDFEVRPSECSNTCMNQVVMPGWACGEEVASEDCVYNYGITSTPTHCAGLPGSCGTPAAGAMVVYRWPVIVDGAARIARLSALEIEDQIFTLPFPDDDLHHNGWLYSPGEWHHALDYSKPDGDTFQVLAAAPGTIVHIGWDNWSGGTVIVSHDVGADRDRYRTIYMHLRNGASNDCASAWNQTVPAFAGDDETTSFYTTYLESTGCSESGERNLQADFWGTEGQTIPSFLGKKVQRGEFLGWAGSTGPGGCGCKDGVGSSNTHLHIFFAHRDPTDDNWYLFDPYGIYGPTECYPTRDDVTGPLGGACVRYPVAWMDGQPQNPPPVVKTFSFRRGDANGDLSVDIADAVQILNVLFVGIGRLDCPDAADMNDDGVVNIADPILGLNFLFAGGVRVPPPGPDRCGEDPTPDRMECDGSSPCD